MIGKRETSCRLIKNNKQLINNYCPVSVTVIYKQSNSCQSGFRPNDSRINELILITHNINRAFDGNLSLEVPGVFQKHLTRSGIKFKLKNNRINGNALQSVDSFFHNRGQRVVLNGQSSSWLSIRAGVSQVAVLGLLFFLIYIKDRPEVLNSEVKLFADDTSLFSVLNCVNTSASALNSDLLKIQDWSNFIKSGSN